MLIFYDVTTTKNAYKQSITYKKFVFCLIYKINKNREMEQTFFNCGTKERILIKKMIEESDIYINHNTTYTYSPIDGYDSYDAIIYLRNKILNEPEEIHIIEAKVRNSNYNTIMLEKLKFDNLCKLQNKLQSKTKKNIIVKKIYLSCHPLQTYFFCLDNLNNINWEEKQLPYSTCGQNGCITKEIANIHIDKSIKINITKKIIDDVYNNS